MDASTLTNEQLVAGGAILGGFFGTFLVCGIAFWILMVVAMWKIFSKAGEAGWKSLIPIYNVYIYFKIAGMKNWFWYNILVAFIGSFVAGLVGYKTTSDGAIADDSSVIGNLIMLAVYIFAIVVAIMQCAKLSKAFGRGIGTTLGLIFLPNIFQLILAFGSAKYDKKTLKK